MKATTCNREVHLIPETEEEGKILQDLWVCGISRECFMDPDLWVLAPKLLTDAECQLGVLPSHRLTKIGLL